MILLKKRTHLVLKTPLAVVRLLLVDVSKQRRDIGRPDGEQTIPPLPCELRNSPLLYPCRRTGLDHRHNLRCRSRGRKLHRKMNMIGNATHAKTFAIQLPRCPSNVSVQRGTNLAMNQRHSKLRTEDNMHQIEAQRLRHTRNHTSAATTRHPTKVALSYPILCTRPTAPKQTHSAKGATHTSLGRRPRSTRNRNRKG